MKQGRCKSCTCLIKRGDQCAWCRCHGYEGNYPIRYQEEKEDLPEESAFVQTLRELEF